MDCTHDKMTDCPSKWYREVKHLHAIIHGKIQSRIPLHVVTMVSETVKVVKLWKTIVPTVSTFWFAITRFTWTFTTKRITWFCMPCVARACFIASLAKCPRSTSCNFLTISNRMKKCISYNTIDVLSIYLTMFYIDTIHLNQFCHFTCFNWVTWQLNLQIFLTSISICRYT